MNTVALVVLKGTPVTCIPDDAKRVRIVEHGWAAGVDLYAHKLIAVLWDQP